MDYPTLKAVLLAFLGATETYPFDETTLVVKVGNKMFALAPTDAATPSVSLKCDPYHAELLRAEYPAITPGYHLNKRHWITVLLDGSVPSELVRSLIAESYALVVASLPRAARP